MRWGLIPSWAKDASIAYRLLNARCESAAEKPAFRAAYRQRRCLVPADGFYEWKTAGKHKQPFVFRPRPAGLCAFAGLWETWRDGDDAPLHTFTIMTTAANDLLRSYHDRMPVIVAPPDFDVWLDPAVPVAELGRLFDPCPSGALTATPVSAWVNDVRHEGPRCLEPPAAPAEEPSLFT
jgi:putative SOS response-associated peptidase YedK